MHIEFLVEDKSGQVALELLVPMIIGPSHTFKISFYKGIGRLPKSMSANGNSEKRILLDQLPRLLQGFGNTFSSYGVGFKAAIVVVCDLDDRNLVDFLAELNGVLARCHPKPKASFCIAIEEGEAWFLGDPAAVAVAYPGAKADVLKDYRFDSICGTWETLADAVFPGGSAVLKRLGWMEAGRLKSEWARTIPAHMNIEANNSESFGHFRNTLREIVKSV
jgi:hypothetical protein